MLSDFTRAIDDSLAQEKAYKAAILSVINDFVIKAEVERLGLTPTLEETLEDMEPHKKSCLSPECAECRQHLQRLGYDDPLQYLDNHVADYAKDLGQIKLQRHFYEGKQIPSEEWLSAWHVYLNHLRSKEDIVWFDSDFELLHQEASR